MLVTYGSWGNSSLLLFYFNVALCYTGDVIKLSGKELLGALPKDCKMFQVMIQIMKQIYWVNASLKSISPVNGMVHNVPLTDFDSFEIGEPAPPAPPSPP